jgi:hypothetical protein
VFVRPLARRRAAAQRPGHDADGPGSFWAT